MKNFSLFISWGFMPILMPFLGLILVMYTPSQPIDISNHYNSLYLFNEHNKVVILSRFLIFSVILPGLMYIFLRNTAIIQTTQLDDKSERRIPMIMMSLFCFFLFYLFFTENAILPKYTYALCLSGGIIIGIFSYVNKFIKISLHATGVGILTGFVFAYVSEQVYFQIWILPFVILISGIVLTTRLYLEKHTPIELIIGYFFSLIITFILNYYFPMEFIISNFNS